jgi:peptide/nickel transport system ATP-binding protein
VTAEPAVRVEGLRVALVSGAPIVEDVGFTVGRGEIVGVVGESGSGKTTTALALLGYARPGARIAAGRVEVAGSELTGRPERQVRALRGRLISYVPQDPSASLDPSLRVGAQLRARRGRDAATPEEALRHVRLPVDAGFLHRFPHELSGGQQQRVAIAAALVGRPPVVVLDEPTTGLDVVTQAHVLEEVRRVREELGVAMVYVSHDLAVVSAVADRILVMYAGRIVEEGPAAAVLGDPRHPYTRGLVRSIPDHRDPQRLAGIEGAAVGVGEWPPGCAFAPRCRHAIAACTAGVPQLEAVADDHAARCLRWRELGPVDALEPATPRIAAHEAAVLEVDGLVASHEGRHGTVVAAHDVSFAVERGACVALVGESGSGKTTIARCIVGLHAPDGGEIRLAGAPLASAARQRGREERRKIQIVFQNPHESLNPRHRVIDAIARPARVLLGLSAAAGAERARELLERVRLPARLASRYPGELSGGECQRVAIARALAAEPELLVCDEVTSALDVSVQAAVLELLDDLRRELSLATLFISHDLGVVASIADRVLVLEQGRVCEQGAVASVLAAPEDAYTRSLVEAAPRLVTGAAS